MEGGSLPKVKSPFFALAEKKHCNNSYCLLSPIPHSCAGFTCSVYVVLLSSVSHTRGSGGVRRLNSVCGATHLVGAELRPECVSPGSVCAVLPPCRGLAGRRAVGEGRWAEVKAACGTGG